MEVTLVAVAGEARSCCMAEALSGTTREEHRMDLKSSRLRIGSRRPRGRMRAPRATCVSWSSRPNWRCGGDACKAVSMTYSSNSW